MESYINYLDRLDNFSIVVGFKGIRDMVLKLIIPILAASLIFSFVVQIFFSWLHPFIRIVIPLIGYALIFFVPYALYAMKKRNINTHLHFFITYAGTISTMKIPRGQLFKRISEKRVFGDISKLFGRIYYLAKGWNLGFAHACRTMSLRSPSKVLGDFLDRFAVIMDFGQDPEQFLYDEQKSVLDDYEVEYQKSLENIKLLQDVFVSFSVAFAFILAIALLAPLLMENLTLEAILKWSLFGFIFIESMILISIKTFIPPDNLMNEESGLNDEQKRIFLWFLGTCTLSIFLLFFINLFFDWPFLFKFAISITPLIIPGILASRLEDTIKRRDAQFPVYVRVLGSAVDVRGGAMISALKSTQVHDFRDVNQMSINLYRRLRVGSEKFKCWSLFAFESGSNLINNFSRIFSESVYLGGNAGKIGKIVSKNMQKIISMRKLRYQLSQGLRAATYGSLIGLTATMYVTAKVSQLLISIFNKPGGMEEGMFSFISSIMPQAIGIDFGSAFMIMAAMIIFHAIASSLILKLVDGGSLYPALLDFIVMVWIGALISWYLPMLVENFLPNLTNVWNPA